MPVENSIGGPSSVLDLMVSYPSIYIEKECFPISCHLFTKSIMDLEAITDIISHPQPISQCANFLHAEFPHIQLHQASSTTDAVRNVIFPSDSMAVAGHKGLRIIII